MKETFKLLIFNSDFYFVKCLLQSFDFFMRSNAELGADFEADVVLFVIPLSPQTATWGSSFDLFFPKRRVHLRW